jgi:hypothetical protein
MPRGAPVKAPTPRAPAKNALQPSRSVPLLEQFRSENASPHGYAARMSALSAAQQERKVRVGQASPRAAAERRACSPARSEPSSRTFPSPRLAYAEAWQSPAVHTAQRSVAGTQRAGLAPRRMLSYALAGRSAPSLDGSKSAASLHVPAAAEKHARASFATPAGAEDCCSDSATTRSDAEAAETTTTGALPAPPPEQVTLERADFRALVVALRNLREQRASDLARLRTANEQLRDLARENEALRTVVRLAVREAPHSMALRNSVARVLTPT